MDEKALKHNVEEICGVSEFIESVNWIKLNQYLQFSRKRLNKLIELFGGTNFKPSVQDFTNYHQPATNCIFSAAEPSDRQILVSAHHDYCAGLGAEDDASGLSLMVELAKYFSGSRLEKNLVFASFDLEEKKLAGSRNFVGSLSEKQLQKIKYVLNLECLASGKDLTLCRSLDGKLQSNNDLIRKLGEEFLRKKQDIKIDNYLFTADSISFNSAKIESVNICSFNYRAYQLGEAYDYYQHPDTIVHTSRDIPENLRYDNSMRVGETLISFIEKELR